MSRVPTLSSPFLLGFDEIERVLDRVVKGADGYPPYNIERLGRANGQPDRLRITLAVAGFTRDQLDVMNLALKAQVEHGTASHVGSHADSGGTDDMVPETHAEEGQHAAPSPI